MVSDFAEPAAFTAPFTNINHLRLVHERVITSTVLHAMSLLMHGLI